MNQNRLNILNNAGRKFLVIETVTMLVLLNIKQYVSFRVAMSHK
jgi:hypothetical protein